MGDTMTEEKAERSRFGMFKDTPGSVKSLRKFCKDRLRIPDGYALQGELAGESDRASIILMASLHDDALTYRILKNLRFNPTEDEADHIFRFEGPLGTFSARMELACLFGFIDDATYQQLNIIREMRNACAHSKHPMTFAEPTLANVAKRLCKPLGFSPAPLTDSRDEIKSTFVAEGIFIYQILAQGSREKAQTMLLDMVLNAAARPPSPDKEK